MAALTKICLAAEEGVVLDQSEVQLLRDCILSLILIWVIDTTLPRRRFKSFHPENICAKNREGVELRSLLGRFWEWMVWSKEGGHSWWNIL